MIANTDHATETNTESKKNGEGMTTLPSGHLRVTFTPSYDECGMRVGFFADVDGLAAVKDMGRTVPERTK